MAGIERYSCLPCEDSLLSTFVGGTICMSACLARESDPSGMIGALE
jgi:hypothetical protein